MSVTVDVGESTLTVLAAMRRSPLAAEGDDPSWDITMLPRPCNVESVTTGQITQSVTAACQDAIHQFNEQMRAERAAQAQVGGAKQ